MTRSAEEQLQAMGQELEQLRSSYASLQKERAHVGMLHRLTSESLADVMRELNRHLTHLHDQKEMKERQLHQTRRENMALIWVLDRFKRDCCSSCIRLLLQLNDEASRIQD